jgi:hypothetical protein
LDDEETRSDQEWRMKKLGIRRLDAASSHLVKMHFAGANFGAIFSVTVILFFMSFMQVCLETAHMTYATYLVYVVQKCSQF